VAAKSQRMRRGRASSSEKTEGIWLGKGVVRKISSPQRVASVSNLCNGPCQWAGNMNKGDCCSGFGERVCPFISGKSSMTGDPLEALRATREERESEKSQKDLCWRNAGAVERRVRAD